MDRDFIRERRGQFLCLSKGVWGSLWLTIQHGVKPQVELLRDAVPYSVWVAGFSLRCIPKACTAAGSWKYELTSVDCDTRPRARTHIFSHTLAFADVSTAVKALKCEYRQYGCYVCHSNESKVSVTGHTKSHPECMCRVGNQQAGCILRM